MQVFCQTQKKRSSQGQSVFNLGPFTNRLTNENAVLKFNYSTGFANSLVERLKDGLPSAAARNDLQQYNGNK